MPDKMKQTVQVSCRPRSTDQLMPLGKSSRSSTNSPFLLENSRSSTSSPILLGLQLQQARRATLRFKMSKHRMSPSKFNLKYKLIEALSPRTAASGMTSSDSLVSNNPDPRALHHRRGDSSSLSTLAPIREAHPKPPPQRWHHGIQTI